MKFLIELNEFSAEIRKMMAKETKSSELLDILVEDDDIEVVLEAIRNSSIKIETVEELSKSQNVAIKSEVAKKTEISKEAIERLAKDDNAGVRYCVAITAYKEPHREIVIKLAKDPNDTVREGLAQGLMERKIQDDEEILQIQMDDACYSIRRCAAIRTRDIDKLNKLSKDKDWTVRINVIENPKTPIATIKEMKNDSNEHCRLYAYQRLTFGKIIGEGI